MNIIRKLFGILGIMSGVVLAIGGIIASVSNNADHFWGGPSTSDPFVGFLSLSAVMVGCVLFVCSFGLLESRKQAQ